MGRDYLITENGYQKSWSLTAITRWPSFLLPHYTVYISRNILMILILDECEQWKCWYLSLAPSPGRPHWPGSHNRSPLPLLLMCRLAADVPAKVTSKKSVTSQIDPTRARGSPLSSRAKVTSVDSHCVWVSLTQRESLVIWTKSWDNARSKENRSSLYESPSLFFSHYLRTQFLAHRMFLGNQLFCLSHYLPLWNIYWQEFLQRGRKSNEVIQKEIDTNILQNTASFLV